MKHLILCLIILLSAALPAPARAQAAPTSATKTYCTSALGYSDMAALKETLLANAQRLIVNELFGELIASITTVEDMVVTSDQIRASSLGFVRISGDPLYANGAAFTEVCVTLTGYVTAEDLALFVPVPRHNRFCRGDETLPAPQLREHVRVETITQLLLNYDPRLADVAQDDLLKLLRDVDDEGSGFLSDSDIYCAEVTGNVLPIEVLALVDAAPVAPVPPATPRPTPTAAAAVPVSTATPVPGQTPNATATAAFATAQAYLSRTPTLTPAQTPTPDATATAIFALSQAVASAEQAGYVDVSVEASGNVTARNPRDGAIYVFVPAGGFVMGSPSGVGQGSEHPKHKPILRAYWIMQTEVTNAMYAACVQAGACSAPGNSKPEYSDWDDAANAQRPVASVDWDQAQAYAQWAGGQLPTEAQWEKACRGTDARTYPWGNEAPTANLANFGGNVGFTKPVGSFPAGASPFGALDMAGNVWEWTADWYGADAYASSSAQDPTGPASGQSRVLRGGTFSRDSDYLRCAYRSRATPGSRDADFGFRVASLDY